jgi:DNA mismatch repair protein MutL
MSQIQLLDDNLINKIAAGEVVERPASVVKELIENSLDAGATKITVELQEGGRKRILISDNGSGMSSADASKALMRHATSKIKSAEDLFNLQTMGFRGEALASISAVSRFTLMTCRQGQNEGLRIQLDGGTAIEEAPWQSAGGTTIICDDLFFNVPVRQKFLKAAQVEYGVVVELMQALSLSHPQTDFTLVHNGKEVLRAPAVPGEAGSLSESALRGRFAQVMKGDAGLGMVYTTAECAYGSMVGLISAPGVERGSAKDMFLFVNGRWIKDKSLRFAVLRGYHSHLLRGKYPVVAIFVTVDPGLVDANVHPAKTEVRLQYSNEIHSMLAGAVREGIRRAEWAAQPSVSAPISSRSSSHLKDDAVTLWDSPQKSSFSTAKADDWSPSSSRASQFAGSSSHNYDAGNESKPARWRDVTPVQNNLFEDIPVARAPVASAASQSIPWAELKYMGSIADCYLLFSHGDRQSGARLLGIDQHAFHERVLYERLTRNTELLKTSQSLLVPEGLILSPREIGALREIKSQLENNGFRFDFMDDHSIEVRAVPVLLAKADLQGLMESMARADDSELPLENNIGLTHDILATMACHGAVRAGEKLGENELKILLNEARDVDFFHNCPHGRRVFRWWDEAQIARWFDR